MAASSKRAAAASQGFFSFSSDMETCGVNWAKGQSSNNIVLCPCGARLQPAAGFPAGALRLIAELSTEQFERLQDRGIALQFHLVAAFHAECLVEDLGLDPVAQEIQLGGPLADIRLDAAGAREGFEFVQNGRCHFKIGVHLVALQVVGGETGDGTAGIERDPQAVQGRWARQVIGVNPATAGYGAALVGVKLLLLVWVNGGGGQLELAGIERLLNGAATGRIVERRGEGQARVLTQREDALHQAFAITDFTHDGGAVVVLQRARNNLRSAGRFFVDQQHEFEFIRRGRFGYGFRLLRHAAAADGKNLLSGLEEQSGRLERRGHHAARVVAQVEHQAGQMLSAQFFDGAADVLAGPFIETGSPDIADAGANEKCAVDARGLHVFGGHHHPRNPVGARPPDIELRRVLARFGEQLGKLIEIEAVDDMPVDAHDFVARREARFRRRRARQGLQHDDAPRQQRNDRAEALLRGGLHLAELVELAGIEEDGMRIELAQQPRNGALIENLFGGNRCGGILLDNGEGVNDPFDLRVKIVRGGERQGGRKQNGEEAKHRLDRRSSILSWCWWDRRSVYVVCQALWLDEE